MCWRWPRPFWRYDQLMIGQGQQPISPRYRAWLFWFFGALAIILIVASSGSYNSCIHEHKNDTKYKALHQNGNPIGPIASRTFARAQLVGFCAAHFTGENESTITAFAGVALALFTLYLWIATKGLRRYAGIQAQDMQQLLVAARTNATAAASQATAMDQLRAAAEAQERAMSAVAQAARQSANIARRALTILERPYVMVEVTEPGIQVAMSGQFSFVKPQPKWEAFNHGRSPALLIDRLTTWKVEADGTLPYAIDPVKQRGSLFPEGSIIAPTLSFSETHNYMADLPKYQEMLDPDAWLKWRIYFMGYVRYGDLLDGVYVNGFCLMFDHRGRPIRTDWPGNTQFYSHRKAPR